jgi:hypothetical protein
MRYIVKNQLAVKLCKVGWGVIVNGQWNDYQNPADLRKMTTWLRTYVKIGGIGRCHAVATANCRSRAYPAEISARFAHSSARSAHHQKTLQFPNFGTRRPQFSYIIRVPGAPISRTYSSRLRPWSAQVAQVPATIKSIEIIEFFKLSAPSGSDLSQFSTKIGSTKMKLRQTSMFNFMQKRTPATNVSP